MKRDARAYSFFVVPGPRLDTALAGEMAALFSSAYGKWSRKSPIRPGEPIRLSAAYYLKNCCSRDYRIALCREGARLVAQAVYVERKTARGICALVVQLLVAPDCRRQGIATSLLHAAWGFSDYCAWGIVTSSPCTVEALEAATFRNCRAAKIARESTFLSKEVLPAVPFLRTAEWQSTCGASCVDTKFFTDRRANPVARRRVEACLGRLAEGWEWLAFTFRDQPLDDLDGYERLIARYDFFRVGSDSHDRADGTEILGMVHKSDTAKSSIEIPAVGGVFNSDGCDSRYRSAASRHINRSSRVPSRNRFGVRSAAVI